MSNKKIIIENLEIINNPKGNIFKFLDKKNKTFNNFGELYISEIKQNKVKAWKLHKEMIMNLVVPVGHVKFVFFNTDFELIYDIIIGENNYKKINVLPSIWFGFKGIDKKNLVLNFSNIIHSDKESLNLDLNTINYEW